MLDFKLNGVISNSTKTILYNSSKDHSLLMKSYIIIRYVRHGIAKLFEMGYKFYL